MKKFIVFALAFIFCLGVPLNAYAETSDNDSNINAKSVVLMCMDTGDVLYCENEYEHLSPASVTKIMTILLTLEAIDSGKISLEDKVTASKNAVSMGGSQIWLEVGETMTVNEILKAVIIASANDACTVLGEYIAGSSTAFVQMMNDRAKELGLQNTNFENCTGLDDTTKNHYSCAYDLAVISKEVMQYDLVKNYTTVWLDSLRNGETELNNTNKLVNTYNGITGLKTGTTSNAGFCISATANRDNMNLCAVVLGAKTSEDRFETASYLLDWGFANYELVEPSIDDSKINSVTIKNGAIKSVQPVYEENAKVLLEKGSDDLTFEYDIDNSVNAPVAKGQQLGTINILSNNEKVGEIALLSPKDVNKVTFSYILRHIVTNI